MSVASCTWQYLAVVGLYDGLACVCRLHARETDASAHSVGVAKNARRDDVAELGEARLEVALRHEGGQVGDVQVGRVLLLLLQTDKNRETFETK